MLIFGRSLVIFFKELLIFIGNADMQRVGETARSSMAGFTPQVAETLELSHSEPRSQHLLPGLPCGWKGLKVSAVRDCIPRPQTGSLLGSEPPSICDLNEFKAGTLTTTLSNQASFGFSNYKTERYLKIRYK